MSQERQSSAAIAILIAGPSAVGKSELAAGLARALRGVVINADSMQVYRDLDILTARPGAELTGGVPHRLYGVIDGAEGFSAADWLKRAESELEEAGKEGRVAIFAGGTGLYFRALSEGLAEIPDIPEEVRGAVRDEADQKGLAPLFAELVRGDPALAERLEPGDRQRILRGLEVLRATGRPLSDWQRAEGAPAPLADALQEGRVRWLLLEADRKWLNRRLEARFRQMVAAGALDEVKALMARGIAADRPVMKAIGVPELAAHLKGELTLEEAISRAVVASRRYAKRQRTWFAHQCRDWPRFPVPDDELIARLVAD